MSKTRKAAAVIGVGAIALGLSLLGATSAQAAGTYQVIDECGFLNDKVLVTGDYQVGYGGHSQDGHTVKTTWAVGEPNPDFPDNSATAMLPVANGTFDLTPCPPPEPAPEPSDPPAEEPVQAPVKNVTKVPVTAPQPVQVDPEPSPEVSETPEATEEPEVVEDEPEVEASQEPVAATASDPTVPIGLVAGGLAAIAAVGGGAFYAGKRGWFTR